MRNGRRSHVVCGVAPNCPAEKATISFLLSSEVSVYRRQSLYVNRRFPDHPGGCPRGLPWSEGVVVKYRDAVDEWFKVKANDTIYVKVIRCIEGCRQARR